MQTFNEQFTASNAVVDYMKLSLNDFIFSVGTSAAGRKNLSHYMIVPRKRGVDGLLDNSYLRVESDFITDVEVDILFNSEVGAYRFLWSNEIPVQASFPQMNHSSLMKFFNSTDSSLANVDVGAYDKIVNATFKSMYFNKINGAVQLLYYVFEHDDSGQVKTYIDHRVEFSDKYLPLKVYGDLGSTLSIQLMWIIMSLVYAYFIKEKIMESWYSEKNLESFGKEEKVTDQDLFSRLLGKSMKEVSGVTEFFYLLSSRLVTLVLKITNTVYIFLKLHTLFTFQVHQLY